MVPATSEIASPIGIANSSFQTNGTARGTGCVRSQGGANDNSRHKIVAKRGAAFTIMVAGESGLGKTTFINTLFSTTIKNYADHKRRHAKQVDKTFEIEITKAELEEKFFKVRLTVIDTPGFGDYVNNRDSWMPIIEFLDDQHESYMLQEQQPRRVDKIDLRVHACLYFIRPTGHTLKPLDIEVMKRLSSRVNLIPVVAKADTLSPADLARFKHRIRAVVEAQGIRIYQPPVEEDDQAAAQYARSLMAAMPFAVIGSEKDVKTGEGRIEKGRQYAWGVAEVENEDHCDFKKLRSILIRTHMLDLIHTTEEMHYEAYRAQQMETRKFGEARPRKLDNPKFKEEEENLRKRFTEQVKVEEHRFRQWEQKLISERDRLNKDLESTHAAYVPRFILPPHQLLLTSLLESRILKGSWSRCRVVLFAVTVVVKVPEGISQCLSFAMPATAEMRKARAVNASMNTSN
ncbi:MAG: Septin spn4 [Pleopsidium flavum]|nr:MAG: Septin spn4 [Pleopsidium flavum]